jgi:hypothetical protein
MSIVAVGTSNDTYSVDIQDVWVKSNSVNCSNGKGGGIYVNVEEGGSDAGPSV